MNFKNNNSVGLDQADLNFVTHSAGQSVNYLVNYETTQFNNKSDEVIGIQKTMSGKTYSANSKTTLKTSRGLTPNSSVFDNYQDNFTRHNIRNYNFDRTVSDRYQFSNMPIHSKQNISTEFQNQNAFEEFKSVGVKRFCAGNTYSTEVNDNKKYTEKSTYCRAIFNNQEFLYRTLAKNARLQRLVKKLVLLRQKQKDEDLWNNYINELKNRHAYPRETMSTHLQNSEEIPLERIKNYYEARPLDPCNNLLKDVYTVHNNFNRNLRFKTLNDSYQSQPEYHRPYVFENQLFCYPTSSQGRLMMLNKERQENLSLNPQHRNCHGNIIFVDKECDKPKRNKTFRKFKPSKSTNTADSQSRIVRYYLNNKSMQTELKYLVPISENKKNDCRVDPVKERYKQVAKNVEKMKRKLEKSNTDVKQNALDNIENKLNSLIQTLNTFMVDIRTNNPFNQGNKSVSVSGRFGDNSLNELIETKSDTFGIIKREEAVCSMMQENSNKTSSYLDASPSTATYMKIDKILNEEIDESKKFKREIEDIMYQRTHRPKAVQITFDVPTRERSTEVTNSLPLANINNNNGVEEIVNLANTSDDRRMTIAVNTDPLGLLGLLRISSEAVKQILSYMPHIDYYSYVSMLQLPLPRNGVPHYICNICGASFERPSQLSDHIQAHNLGYSRDCCVCRHVLDMKRHRPGLFKCKHCGQRFIRAYCCELHEETCAKRLGVPHDVHSNLKLLH